MLSSLGKLSKVTVMMTSVSMFLKNVLAVDMNLLSICLIYQSKKGFPRLLKNF